MSRRSIRDAPLECKIYVGDLPKDATERELEEAFSYYGRLKNVWVARNPHGFAFVEFEDARDASDAVRGLDGKRICGVKARVEHSSGKIRPKPWLRDSRGAPKRRNDYYDRRDDNYDRRYRRSRSYERRRSYSKSRSRSHDRYRETYRRGRSRSTSRKRNYSHSKSRDRSISPNLKSPIHDDLRDDIIRDGSRSDRSDR